ncbi:MULTISPECIES: aminotransferase class I/II-fold pyridoxal phosphate-dependent enzyme [unclassified Sphingomonas]|uniref:aminotransferase class I/II-fold pyridoxal phosphate-dependent enzyme n=1 Tax=unclassified Sphingomonas TaxID=196159 RepID=UPI002269C7CD|nr:MULTISPECIES: aminotransferase class I/II-fold pyridoxal phosphate-dependent enzyme [unclassified Sphingomonas]
MAADRSGVEGRKVRGLSEHGGRLDVAAARFPAAPRPWLDLSTGINPLRWDGEAGPVDLGALPSPAALAALESAAAALFGVAAERVAAVPGSEMGLRALAGLDLPAPHAHVAPAYGTHAAIWADGVAIGVDALDATASRGGTILLANPNNPDGRLLAPDRLLALARALGARGGWLVVDEAFADTDPAIGLLPHLAADDPVLVLRSFGKFFGVAGVRLGFLCGPPAMLDRLRARLGAWPVSAQAIAIGTAAYRDAGWIAATRARLPVMARDLDTVLIEHGLVPVGACPLFRLVTRGDVPTLFDRLARAGILTRPFADTPHLRFGLPGDAAGLARLDRALRG